MDPITLGALNKLNRKINDIQSIPDEKITAAVNAYLDENPVQPVDIATVQEANEYLGIQ